MGKIKPKQTPIHEAKKRSEKANELANQGMFTSYEYQAQDKPAQSMP